MKRNFSPLIFLFVLLAVVLMPLHPVISAPAGSLRGVFDKAKDLFNNGDYDRALVEYKTALNITPDSIEAILNMAILYKDVQDYKKSIREYSRLLKIKPDKLIYFNLGEVYYLNAQADEALKFFERALELGQKGALIHFWMGECYRTKQDEENAINEYKKALIADPEFALAYLQIGRIYKQKRSWTEAERALERVKETDPSMTDVFTELAEVYYNQENYEQALEAFRKVKSIDPANEEAQLYTEKIMKLAGSKLGEKLKSRETQRLAEKTPKAVGPVKAAGAPLLSVHIGDLNRLRFKCSADFSLEEKEEGRVFFQGSRETLYNIEVEGKKVAINSENKKLAETGKPFLIVPGDKDATTLIFDVKFGEGNYWAASMDGSYRGKLELSVLADNNIRLLNIINMEEYIYGVLPSEMDSSWPLQALKAQAIAARSEAYAKMNRHKKDGFNFCSQVHCQVYSGARVEDPRTNQAVKETCGVIAVYNEKPIDAIYSNSCGGHTQGNIFGEQENIPYLSGKPDFIGDNGFSFPLSPLELEDWLWGKNISAFCNNDKISRNSNFRWMRFYDAEELSRLVAKEKNIGRVRGLEIMGRSRSGHIKKVKITGSKGILIMEKELKIRRLLGNLRSSMFCLDIKKNRQGQAEEFIFYGGGWGHAVGMCQVGAATMAEQGYDYEQILKFYYTGIELKKMY